ncbi:VOC family protein [Subtercola sp. YIM 133946]|uniref:VOC family protein n=1 Tax=Subtercola sp. YIM 133946 TaxID=3118909 RepID=UPI002F95EF4C
MDFEHLTGDDVTTQRNARPGLPEPLSTGILQSVFASPIRHLAYITNDTVAAIEHFESIGVGSWTTFDVRDGAVRASFSHLPGCSTPWFEIVEPLVDAPPIFPLITADDPWISLHHVGAHLDVDANAASSEATEAGLSVHRSQVARGDITAEVVYVDARNALGHWLEVLCPATTVSREGTMIG